MAEWHRLKVVLPRPCVPYDNIRMDVMPSAGMEKNMTQSRKLLAEFIGTFWLVLGGCGSAVLAAAFPYAATPEESVNFYGLGFLGVALAFGLTVLTMAYAIGHISGCHLNPAVSIGLWASGRFRGAEVAPYIVAQVLGAIVGGGVVYLIASGRPDFVLGGSNPLASNGYGLHSPGGYNLFACLLTEVVLT